MNTFLTIKEKQDWNYFIKRANSYDTYHLWEYHDIDPSGEPMLFVLQKGHLFIALPLIKRKIPNSTLYDLTSVYGYSGPVSNERFENLNEGLLQEFQDSFMEFMNKENCISVFSRLHPFINQRLLLNRFGGIYENGKTLYVDLTVPYEEQIEDYDKRLAKQIRNLKARNYEVVESSDRKAIKLFTEMYTENMLRVGASGSYFFKEEYFANLLEHNPETSTLMMVYDQGNPTGGALLLHSKDIIRQHLSATSIDYLKESPSKFITDEVSLLGRRIGARYYHMGGGVGGQEDSLFKFKASFTKTTLDDYTWRFIADNQAYNALVEERGAAQLKQGFFPLYRSRIAETAEITE